MKTQEKHKPNKSSRPRRSIPIEKVILFLAAGFAAYNFGLAGGYIEGTKFSTGGLIAGIVVNISIAIAASRFGTLRGDKRTRQANYAFLGMLFLSPLVVSPVIFYSLPQTFLEVWWLRAGWSVGWVLIADLAIVLSGAVSGKGLIALSDEAPAAVRAGASQSVAGANGASKSAGRKSQSAEAATDSSAVRRTYPRKCDHCTEILRSANAVGGHMKKHHPELCKKSKTPLAVGLFAKVENALAPGASAGVESKS